MQYWNRFRLSIHPLYSLMHLTLCEYCRYWISYDFNFSDITTTDSTSSVDPSSIINNGPSSSESTSKTLFPSISPTTESDNSVTGTTMVTIDDDIADASTPSPKITTIGGQSVGYDRDTSETSAKSESIASSTSTSSTINAESTTNRNDEISHRDYGRALNLTKVASAIPAKGKALNDLSDVSMDDDTDGNGAKEEMVIAQTQRKECESKVREMIFESSELQYYSIERHK